jgi:hypothetical protein
MVREILQNDGRFYKCEVCSLFYKERSWAEKCEEYCKKYKACSLEITKHSIQMRS